MPWCYKLRGYLSSARYYLVWRCGYRIGDLVEVGHHDARGGGDVRGDQEVVVELPRDVEVGEEVLLVAAVSYPQHSSVRHPGVAVVRASIQGSRRLKLKWNLREPSNEALLAAHLRL